MATNRNKVQFQLYDMQRNAILSTGGKVYVATGGDAAKQAITDVDGTSLTNPRSLTAGGCEFYVVDTVSTVDLYIMAPGGQFVVKTSVTPGEIQDVYVDLQQRDQVAVIPFSISDTSANTETDTGFDFPVNVAVGPNPGVRTLTVDATEDIDVGLLSSETNGDADGFIDGVSVATAVYAKATRTNGSDTMGALLSVQDSANAGDLAPEPHVVSGANATSITYTLSAGTDTAEGYIYLPYTLMT